MRSTASRSMPAARWPGDPAAQSRFQERQKALEDAAAQDSAAPFTSDARFTRLMNNATAVLRARSALSDAAAAARDTATLVPKLVAEAGALGQGLPPANAGPSAGALERFEARAQRLQLDVTALTQGSADPGQAAQHIAESRRLPGPGDLRAGRRHLGARAAQGHHARRAQAPEEPRLDLHRPVRRREARRGRSAGAAGGAERRARHRRGRARPGRHRDRSAAAADGGGLLGYLPLVLLAAGSRCCWPRSPRRCACTARWSASAPPRTPSARKPTATSRPSCGCSMSSRASPTAT